MNIDALAAKIPCYLSTPEHLRRKSWSWSIYTDKGELELCATSLSFSGRKGSRLQIPLVAIKDIRLGSFPRVAKPFGLDYIQISFTCGTLERTALLTPAISWATPTWETNRLVAEWYDRIHLAVAEHTSEEAA